MNSVCSICHGNMKPWLSMPMDSKTFKNIEYSEVYQCEDCSHGELSPKPPSEKIPLFYELDKYYTQGESHFIDHPIRLHDRLLTKLAWIFDEGIDFKSDDFIGGLLPDSIICEIGCGHGKNLIGFKTKGFTVIGVDPDLKAVETAKKNGIKTILGTAENLPAEIQPDTIDFILMSHSLEHCVDPSLALKNVAKALKPGGVFVCEVPNSASTYFLWNNICCEMLDIPRHLHFFTAKSLGKAIGSVGLTVQEIKYCGFTRHHSKKWREQEVLIHNHLSKLAANKLPPKHSFLRSLLLWAVTFWASPEKKYDSVRIIAKKI